LIVGLAAEVQHVLSFLNQEIAVIEVLSGRLPGFRRFLDVDIRAEAKYASASIC